MHFFKTQLNSRSNCSKKSTLNLSIRDVLNFKFLEVPTQILPSFNLSLQIGMGSNISMFLYQFSFNLQSHKFLSTLTFLSQFERVSSYIFSRIFNSRSNCSKNFTLDLSIRDVMNFKLLEVPTQTLPSSNLPLISSSIMCSRFL